MSNEPNIELTTSGEQAVNDAKAALSGMDSEAVTHVRIELTRGEEEDGDPPALPAREDETNDGTPWRAHHTNATATVRPGTNAFGALEAVTEMGDVTSPELAEASNFSEKRSSTLLSDLYNKGALVRREDEFPYRYKINEDAEIDGGIQ